MANVTTMDTKIFCRDDDSETKYEVGFETRNRTFYEKVVAVCRECIDDKENIKEDIRSEIKESAPCEKFDIVEAFMRLLWGRKIRRCDWQSQEYIYLFTAAIEPSIRNQNNIMMDTDVCLFTTEAREHMW